MVTKKDFKAVAEIIAGGYIDQEKFCTVANFNKAYTIGANQTLHEIGRKLADYFATQNPRFDRQKFLDACGLQAGKAGNG